MNDDTSPLAQADDAKRRRDLGGELESLMQGHDSLESAPWYPAQSGDIIHVHYSALGSEPAWGETYAVVADAHDSLILRALHHSSPDPDVGFGFFAPGLADEPLMDMWMEAGPKALTVVRHGRVVHPAP